ncbi:MAG: hypothetical protein R3Y40_08290, partial [Eubacteriales bacterium]
MQQTALALFLILLNTILGKKWKLLQKLKYNFIAGDLVIAQVFWSFSYDMKFIDVDLITWDSQRYIAFKMMFIVALYIFWIFLAYLYRIRKTEEGKIFIRVSLIYFILMGINIFITWPGNWRWDEVFTLDMARGLVVNYWQHYLTTIQYVVSAMFIPLPGGIIIVQNFIIALIVGYVVKEMVVFFKGSKLPYLVILILLLPTVVWHNLYPLRLTLNSYLEVLFLVLTLKFIYGKMEFKRMNMLGYLALSSLIAIWRTEAFYYILMVPVFICIINYKEFHKIIHKKNILQSG